MPGDAMKVPGIEEIARTISKEIWGFDYTPREPHHVPDERWGLAKAAAIAVFETHVRQMQVNAWLQCVTKIDGSFTAFDELDANEYANRAITQLKEPRHD